MFSGETPCLLRHEWGQFTEVGACVLVFGVNLRRKISKNNSSIIIACLRLSY